VDVSVETQLEYETLQAWVDQSPVVEGAELYAELREGLTAAYAEWRKARARGWRGQADADKALAEIVSLSYLLDGVTECLEWRRGQYLATGRAWPLARIG
jgi:hypothetical protein